MKTFRVTVVVAVALTFMFIQESSAVPLTEVQKAEEVKEVEEVGEGEALSNDIQPAQQTETAVDSLLMLYDSKQDRGIRCRLCCNCCGLSNFCGICCRF